MGSFFSQFVKRKIHTFVGIVVVYDDMRNESLLLWFKVREIVCVVCMTGLDSDWG